MTLSEIVWLTPCEAQVSLIGESDDGEACLHVEVNVDDDHKGRSYTVRLVDIEGDPDGEAWLRSNESTLLDHYDDNLAKQQGRWC